MKHQLLHLALLLFLAPAFAQKSHTIPMDAAAWELNGNDVKFLTHLGQPAMQIPDRAPTEAGKKLTTVRDILFADGTIEYDIAFTETPRFSSIYFRQKDEQNGEHFYLRGFWKDDPSINTAIQYAAILNDVNLWDLSAEYQSNATLKTAAWNHVKLIVRGEQLLVFVNNMETPALYVPKMDGGWSEGKIAFDGGAYISNVKIISGATPGLSGGEGYDITANDSRYLRNWQVTEPVGLPAGQEPTAAMLPGEKTSWSGITAERHGLVNLTRRFGATPRGTRRMVWLRTTIAASKNQLRKLDFGFSDEVYVYLNGRPFHQDKNLYNTPGMKTPRGRCSLENSRIELPLAAGDNELLIGVTNFFFGWGIMARLDDVEGLRY